MSASTEFIEARIAAIEARIIAYENIALQVVENGAQEEYRYDTGQEVIRVKRYDIGSLEDLIDRLMNQRQILCQRIGLASGSHNSRGSW